ncbi:MAG: transglycosylase domain-containing protein [Candidatus Nanopelagicales bacterium]
MAERDEKSPKRRRRLIDYPRRNKTGIRHWLPSWKLILGSFATFILVLVGGFAAAVAFTTIPQANEVARAEKTIVYWNDGTTEMGQLGEANRISVPLSDVPSDTQHAVLAAEDRDFYQHGGFDPTALVRATLNDVRGGATQGASTITQQYAKNAYLSQDQTLIRKARELVLSVKLETQSSKDDILSDYLNTIYFGRGAYGIETASQAYFGRPVSELNLNQSAALAAIIRAPGGYAPENNKDKLQARFDYVISGMVTKGWITQAQADAASLPKFQDYKPIRSSLRGTNGYLLESVQREMISRGYSEEDLNLGGFRVVTTFDKNAQRDAVNAVETSGPGPEKGLRIGLTSVDAQTGEVVAMYGGANYLKNQYSNADQATALAGSTFKPFALAAATEQGIGLDSYWDGSSPRTIQGYTLQNEDNASYGTISLLSATENSVNTVYVDLATQLGTDNVMNAAVRAGVPQDTVGLKADPTTVLGTASPTTEVMAGAYATFANGGKQIKPTTIKEISRDGRVEYTYQPQANRAFTQDVANTVNYALQKVVTSGTGYAAASIGRPAAGKTGTTDNNRSAWFVGYTPQLSTAVMMAKQNSKGESISLYGTGGGGSVYGGSYPARIWATYMAAATADQPVENFTDPANMVSDYSNSPSQTPSPSQSASESPTPSATTRRPIPSATASSPQSAAPPRQRPTPSAVTPAP